MRIKLNIEKSIERDCVVNDNSDFDTQFNEYFNILFRLFFVGMLLGFPIFIWMGSYTGTLRSDDIIYFPGILFTFGLIGVYGSLFRNKFIRFRGGHDINKNREIILELFKGYYPKNHFYKGENFLTSYFEPNGFLGRTKPTKRILIIFDRTDILINISVFSDAGVQSPFHPLFHHLKIHRIKNKFTKEINGWD
jgi:hypothetical protein